MFYAKYAMDSHNRKNAKAMESLDDETTVPTHLPASTKNHK